VLYGSSLSNVSGIQLVHTVVLAKVYVHLAHRKYQSKHGIECVFLASTFELMESVAMNGILIKV
jgi:hypothetical protein